MTQGSARMVRASSKSHPKLRICTRNPWHGQEQPLSLFSSPRMRISLVNRPPSKADLDIYMTCLQYTTFRHVELEGNLCLEEHEAQTGDYRTMREGDFTQGRERV